MGMKIKKIFSLVFSLLICVTAAVGGLSAKATDTVTYSFEIKTTEAIAGFKGTVYYPSESLSVNSVTVAGDSYYSDKGGSISINSSNPQNPLSFSPAANVVTVTFNVNGTYDRTDVYTTLKSIYTKEMVTGGNVPFTYRNLINGTKVTSGKTDIDNPQNSYEGTAFTVTYNYNVSPTDGKSITKTVYTEETTANKIAEVGMPSPRSPYYTYDLGRVDQVSASNLTASLRATARKYDVSVDGVLQDRYGYMDTATVTADEEKSFIINGDVVATGTSFSFYVTGDIDVTLGDPAESDEGISVVKNAQYVYDDAGSTYVKLELLATANRKDFARMGTAFSLSEKSDGEITQAVTNISSGSGTDSKIHIHNSGVDAPNLSGRYQFIYAPYIDVSKIPAGRTMYVYAYSVNADGEVLVSYPAQINLSNIRT